MIELADADLARDLHRLAVALVPDDAYSDAETLGDRWSGHQVVGTAADPEAGELQIVVEPSLHRRARPDRSRTMTLVAAGLVILAGIGAFVALGRLGASPQASPPPSAPTIAPPFDPGLRWRDGVDMIIYVDPQAHLADIAAIRSLLESTDAIDTDRLAYLDFAQSMAEARLILADNPETLSHLDENNLPTMFKVWALAGSDAELAQLAASLRDLARVQAVLEASGVPVGLLMEATSIEAGTGAIVFIDPGALPSEIDAIRLAALELVDADHLEHLDPAESLAVAAALPTLDPVTLALFDTDNIPTQYILRADIELLHSLDQYRMLQLMNLPGVITVKTADQIATPPADTIPTP